MASRRISVNVSGSRAAIIASKKTVEASENVETQERVLSFEELRMKNAREWKHATEEDRTEYHWHLKEKNQGKPESILLFCSADPYIQADYNLLGLLRDICVVPGTDIVYAQVKQAKTFAKIRYALKIAKYNVQENFTDFCQGVVDEIESRRVSLNIDIILKLVLLYLGYHNVIDLIR